MTTNFATNVQMSLRMGLSLSPASRRSMIHRVRDYLLNDLKDISLPTTKSISQQIVDNYKKTFTTKISNQNTDGQVESLRQAIYFAAHYIKGQALEKLDNSDDDYYMYIIFAFSKFISRPISFIASPRLLNISSKPCHDL